MQQARRVSPGPFGQKDCVMQEYTASNSPFRAQDATPVAVNPAPVELREVLNSIFFHRRAAMVVASVVLALGLAVALVMPARYTVEARLLPLSTGVYDTGEANAPRLPGQALDPAAVANVEQQLLLSLDLHRQVVRDLLPPGAGDADLSRAVGRFEKDFTVAKVNDTNVIEITYSASDPNRAVAVLNRVIRGYYQARANALTAGRVAYLQRQADEASRQMDAADADPTAFQRAHNIVDISAQIAGAVKENDTLRLAWQTEQANLADNHHSIRSLRSALSVIPRDVELYTDNGEAARATGEMRSQLLALQAKRADLAARYMPGSPLVVQADAQIAALETALNGQKGGVPDTRRSGRNQVFDTASIRLVDAEVSAAGNAGRKAALTSEVQQSDQRLSRFNDIGQRLAQLRLARDLASENYKSLAIQVAQAKVQLNQDSVDGNPSVRLIEAPSVPISRSNPRSLIVAAAVLVALVMAAVTVGLLTSLREVFLSPREVEAASGLPVLAAPLAGDQSENGQASVLRMLSAISANMLAREGSVLFIEPASRRNLQTAALWLGKALDGLRPGRALLLRFAAGGQPLRSEADLLLDRVGRLPAAVVDVGLCKNLAGSMQLIRALKARFGHVVVTSPPVSAGPEALLLSQAVDHVIVVVECEVTRRPVLVELLRQLAQLNVEVTGLLLLGRRSHIPGWLYALLFNRGVTPGTPRIFASWRRRARG